MMKELPKAIIISASIIGVAIVWSGFSRHDPRFDLRAAGELIYRLDNQTGQLWACTQAGCWLVPIQNKTLEQSSAGAEDLNALANAAADNAEDQALKNSE